MIISHSRRFIFIKSRKTAGTSLEIALTRYCGPKDILTELDDADEKNRLEWIGAGARNYAIPFRELSLKNKVRRLAGLHRKFDNDSVHRLSRFNEHDSAVKVRTLLGRETFDAYYKFTIVRNPFDRVISSYAFEAHRLNRTFEERGISDIGQYIRHMPQLVNENWRLYTQSDRILMDDFIRYERVEEDLKRVSTRIGLDHNLFDDFKNIRSKSGFRPRGVDWRAILTANDRHLVAALCRLEIERFGYDHENTGAAA